MGLKNYFVGQSFDLVSPLPPEEVKRRLREVGGSIISVGFRVRVRGNRVRIEWRMPLVRDRLAPRFVGRLEDELGRTRLRAKYVPTLWARFLMLFCGLMALGLLSGLSQDYLFGDPPPAAERNMRLIVIGFLSLPILAEWFASAMSKRDLVDILALLEREAMLRPHSS